MRGDELRELRLNLKGLIVFVSAISDTVSTTPDAANPLMHFDGHVMSRILDDRRGQTREPHFPSDKTTRWGWEDTKRTMEEWST